MVLGYYWNNWMVKSGFGSKPRVKGNVGGGAEHLESRIGSLESLRLSHEVQALSQIGGKGFCLQQKNTNTNEFDVYIVYIVFIHKYKPSGMIKTNPCLHHVLLGELVLLNKAHVILV